MEMKSDKKYRCKLCGHDYTKAEMSEEHYPARSVGNENIVKLDLIKMINSLQSQELYLEVEKRNNCGETLEKIADNIFDTKLSNPLYPEGRTTKSLCIKCNTFLGKYDEAYLKFFKVVGEPTELKGFQEHTKYQIIKSIYAKFLSVPEAKNEEFDFIDFVNDESSTCYDGKWNLYFVKRDFSTDLLGLKDLETGELICDEGVVYELSDEHFIYNLMNFKKPDCFEMTNIFDILNKDYKLVEGVGEYGGYHGQIVMTRHLKNLI